MLKLICLKVNIIQPTWKSIKLDESIASHFNKIIYQTKYEYQLENPYDEQVLNRFEKAIKHHLLSLGQIENFIKIKEKADRLIGKLRFDGFSPARENIYLLKN